MTIGSYTPTYHCMTSAEYFKQEADRQAQLDKDRADFTDTIVWVFTRWWIDIPLVIIITFFVTISLV